MHLLFSRLFLLCAVVGRAAADNGTVAAAKRDSYIIQFQDELAADKVRTLEGVQIVHHYNSSVFSGMAVSTSSSVGPEQLAQVAGVKAVTPNRLHRPRNPSARGHMNPLEGGIAVNGTSDILHEKTGLLRVIEELQLDGSGIKIGLVDSGLDYNHPDLGQCYKTDGCKWQYGGDFTTGTDDPMDCWGQGTHSAGVLAATGDQVRGVAPQATFGMYKVFACEQEAETAVILRALEAAAQDKMDIISLAVGGGSFPDDPVAQAAANLVAQGIVVVAPAGENGQSGLFTVDGPSLGAGVISVGAVNNWQVKSPQLIFTSEAGSFAAYKGASGYAEGTAAAPFIFEDPVDLFRPADNAEGCSAWGAEAGIQGKIVLLDYGNCTNAQRVAQAQEAGAVGVIIADNEEGPWLFQALVDETVVIPVATVQMMDGEAVTDMAAQSPVQVTAPAQSWGNFDIHNGGQMTASSPYGPTAELGMGPTISAPGGYIWSTYPVVSGSYATRSTTYSAAPYVAGAAALLKQARPDLTAEQVRSILVTTAMPLQDDTTGGLVSPYRAGGGLVNIYQALQARVMVDPPLVAINDTAYEPVPRNISQEAIRTIKVTNQDPDKSVHIWMYHSVAQSITMFQPDGTLMEAVYQGQELPTWPADHTPVDNTTQPLISTLTLEQDTAPGQTAEFSVIFTPPQAGDQTENWCYGGYVDFRLQWEGETTQSRYVVPYSGFSGNFSSLPVLSPQTPPTWQQPVPEAGVSVANPAALAYTMAMPSRQVLASLVDVTGQTVGYLPGSFNHHQPRTPIYLETPPVIMVDGQVYPDLAAPDQVAVAPGKYHIHLAALRPLGQMGTEADYDTWDSEEFIVAASP
ncbi:hypothetical protein GGF46_001409 [Coemansia sp. RSA 552]|nr:hypothetical protein GGF46_001409 [Coemansia sp. RSA 552]